jgi:SAM-dependent methyltransferase
MTWEETIMHIRSNADYSELVKQAYFHEDLEMNVKAFRESNEFYQTMKLFDDKVKPGATILDVGCGNGIAALAFALNGFNVVAIDPDASETVGTGAVKKMQAQFGLNNLEVRTVTAENLKLPPESFDVVYARQSMHHANNLNKYVANCSTFLKSGGLFITVRDHVVYDKRDKQKFLKEHPLHKFYGGENAFMSSEYRTAFQRAGLSILREIKFFDSEINFSPLTIESIESNIRREEHLIRNSLEKRLGTLGKSDIVFQLYKSIIFNPAQLRDEKYYSGRMYSYVCLKK